MKTSTPMSAAASLFLSLVYVCIMDIVTARPSIYAVQPAGPWTAWKGVEVNWVHPSPQSTDWVGAFLETWNATYVSWQPLNCDDGTTTSGRLSFDLLNGRQPFIFRLFRGDEVVATSNAVKPLSSAPNQGHLSLVPGHPNQMTISWTSDGSMGPGGVRWGLTPNSLDNWAPATVDTYAAHDLTKCMQVPPMPPRTTPFANISNHKIRCDHCWIDSTGPELFMDPGMLHTATMIHLEAGERIYYQFGAVFFSHVYSFATPRKPGDQTPFTFLVTSDMGIGSPKLHEQGGATDNDPPFNGADTVVAGILNDAATSNDEFMLLNGDLSYARGWPWIWERFFDQMQPLATAMPLMVSVGNHEVDSIANPFRDASGGDSGGECGVVVMKRFTHIESIDRMWYSFTYGTVHMVIISTEHPIEPQLAWFEEAVAAVDRKVVPWLIVAMHRPLFNSQTIGFGVDDDKVRMDLKKWHKVFVRHRVDMVYAGHAHYYERNCAVEYIDGFGHDDLYCSTTRDRPVYVTDGSAGAEFSPVHTDHSRITEYKEFKFWGYSRFEVTPETLTFRHHRTDTSVVDDVVIHRAQ